MHDFLIEHRSWSGTWRALSHSTGSPHAKFLCATEAATAHTHPPTGMSNSEERQPVSNDLTTLAEAPATSDS